MKKTPISFIRIILEVSLPFVLLWLALLSAPYLVENVLNLKLPVEHFTLFDKPNYPLIYSKWIFNCLVFLSFGVISYASIRMYRSKRKISLWEIAFTYLLATPLSVFLLLATSMALFGK